MIPVSRITSSEDVLMAAMAGLSVKSYESGSDAFMRELQRRLKLREQQAEVSKTEAQKS